MNQRGNQNLTEDEDPELNEELYDRLMVSIEAVWPHFDIDNGVIKKHTFKKVMTRIADHQGVRAKQDGAIFFTELNLENIFGQI